MGLAEFHESSQQSGDYSVVNSSDIFETTGSKKDLDFLSSVVEAR